MTHNAQAADESAIFAGGCFWCIEAELQELDGVKSVTSGYTGGENPHPTYEQVSSGTTGHYEAVEVRYDPSVISYDTLLDAFWSNIDPTDAGGQMFDRGSHYRTAIFYQNDTQKHKAESSREAAGQKLGAPIATAILPASAFYAAEDKHQDFYQTNPDHYNAYKTGSRRKETLRRVWGDKKE